MMEVVPFSNITLAKREGCAIEVRARGEHATGGEVEAVDHAEGVARARRCGHVGAPLHEHERRVARPGAEPRRHAAEQPRERPAVEDHRVASERAGDPGDNVPGKVIVIPEKVEQIKAKDFDLARMRKSYVRNAVKNAPEGYVPTADDIAFLAADTNTDEATVEAILAELKEA